MQFLSVCAGIEAASVAWSPLGWAPLAFSEIDKFPCAVLAHHYPETPNWGDLTTWQEWPDATLDLLVGGTPCQSFSVAGLRQGLADPRGGLLYAYLAVARRYRPRWVVWENVPGVLSSDDGRAFGTLLRGLADLGYGFAYRVLDAQYFGLAQRRARVFVVGHLGDWRRAAAVLFEPESLSGHPAPRREAGQVAPTVPSRRTGGGGLGTDFDCDGGLVGALTEDPSAGFEANVQNLIAFGGNNTAGPIDVATACNHHAGRYDFESETLLAFNWQSGGDARGLKAQAQAQALSRCQVPAVAFAENQRSELVTSDTAGSLKVGGRKPGQGYPAVQAGMQVRRLTPRECERLQGFPDDYTLIPYGKRGRPAKDGPRYKALGNSMAVPVMWWVGKRMAMVDEFSGSTCMERCRECHKFWPIYR
jgi:DNA (cytosine-5)-methyltransferase 1